MQQALPDRTTRRGPEVTFWSGVLILLIMTVCFSAVSLFMVLPDYFHATWCPATTFDRDTTLGFPEVLLAIFISMPCALAFVIYLAGRATLLKCKDGSSFLDAARLGPGGAIYAALPALLIGCLLEVDAVDRFQCITQSAFIMRHGMFDRHRETAWSDVRAVTARCWLAKSKGRSPYPDADLVFLLSDGQQIRLPLMAGGEQVRIDKYRLARMALASNTTYHYYLNPSVNADTCPAAILPMLRDWNGW